MRGNLLDAGFPPDHVIAAALERAKRIVEGLPQNRAELFDDRAVKIALVALRAAFPSAGPIQLGTALTGIRSSHLTAAAGIAATRLWWPDEAVEHLVKALKAKRAGRPAKPLPDGFDTTDPTLPRCGPKGVTSKVAIVRKVMKAKPKRPIGIAKPWDPAEARQARRAVPQHVITHVLMGDPPPSRSAWAQRQAEAHRGEVRA